MSQVWKFNDLQKSQAPQKQNKEIIFCKKSHHSVSLGCIIVRTEEKMHFLLLLAFVLFLSKNKSQISKYSCKAKNIKGN